MTIKNEAKPPKGTKAAGRRLWDAVLADYALEEHELGLLREMVRTVDLLDQLQATIDAEQGPWLEREGRIHPAVIEARHQRIALARLGAALRLPAGDEDDQQAGARRPQRRVGVRGAYKPRLVG